MIKHIKIFGERNSGTNFLEQLVRRNIIDINVCSSFYIGSGWKHGFPRIELFNEVNETLFIFIIRDLESWLISMYNNPYSFICPDNISAFISEKLCINDLRMDHDVHTNKEEQQPNIISLRYAKIKSYERFFDKVPNAIFINLQDLQENNDKFLNFIRDTYSLNISEHIYRIDLHTKNPIITHHTRTYDTVLPTIHNKDVEVENMVASLKEAYRFKASDTVRKVC